jgi:hypothetical protein
MKNFTLGILFILALFPLSSLAQLNNGGINAYFGVDGDTKSNYVKYGPFTGLIGSDDWWSSTGASVIDTTNASTYLSLLSGGANIGFNKRMSVPLYSKINGKLWLDAVYGRDYLCTNPLVDSTIFTIAAKNGDNPINWQGGKSNVPDKNDLVDVYAHMRRDGTDVHDSLWFFTGVSTVGTSGSRYFDIELYKNNFAYNSATGTFTTAGPDAGHTQWNFDASGNITQTGDMIVAVTYTPGMAPVVDVRIWVSSTTFTSVVPAYFNFGPTLDGATAAFGYVSILSKSGATAFGSGIANYSATPAQDTTYSTPWGTELSSKTWGAQYQTLQLIEVGLNLTRIGVDPALYSTLGLNPCQSLFSDIFFKSRSSASFVSNMQDFVTPLTFLRNPVMDYSLQPDTLRCNRKTATIQITNNSTAGYYSWQTTNGNITGSNSDSSQINLNKPGTYIVSSSPAVGCPATRTDTVVIPIDTFPPVASIFATVGSNFSYLQLYGGDVAASNYMTPFGGSKGLLWNWSGPNGFTSTIQNPITDTAWGTYQLIVTEKRNGCTDTATQVLSYVDFIVLATEDIRLTGTYVNKGVSLSWSDKNQVSDASYEIEKSTDGTNFASLGSIQNTLRQDSSEPASFLYVDNRPAYGINYYRIKSAGVNGMISYSNIIEVKVGPGNQQEFRIVKNYDGTGTSLLCNVDKASSGTIVLYNISGQRLESRNIQLGQGVNMINLPVDYNLKNSVIVVALFLDNQLTFAQKTVF